MNKAQKSQQEIADAIGSTQPTISKELSRNRGQRGYRAKQAQEKATNRMEDKRSRPWVIVGEIQKEVVERLNRKHSPKQISGKLAKSSVFVSAETIYQFIFEDKRKGGELYKDLRINGKRRYRRRAKNKRKGKILNRVGIEKRPKALELRVRYGDWEVDLIEGSKGSGFFLSLYERKSHTGLLVYMKTKGAKSTAKAIIRVLRGYRVRTLTYDNGLEFANHEEVSKALGSKAYFCNPYHSWEKGGVENYNGLVRQYYPKGSSFSEVDIQELARVEKEINERPRETLMFKSPSELGYHLRVTVAEAA
jgi:IS30 family transposase